MSLFLYKLINNIEMGKAMECGERFDPVTDITMHVEYHLRIVRKYGRHVTTGSSCSIMN